MTPLTSQERKALLLTEQELRALTLSANGFTDDAAGRYCHISPRTHRRRLISAETKLGARSRPHAVAIAITAGLIRLGGAR